MTIEVTLTNIEKLLETIARNTTGPTMAANAPKPADSVTVVTPIKPARNAKPRPEAAPAPAVVTPTPAPAPVAEEEDDFLADDAPAAAAALTKDDVRAAFVKLQNGRPDGKNQVYAVLKALGASSLGTLAVGEYQAAVNRVEELLK